MRRLAFVVAGVLVVGSLAGCPSKAPDDGGGVAAATGGKGAPVAKAGGAAPGGALTGKLVLYIPCGLTIPMKAVVQAFKAANPGLEVTEEYDSAVVLARRIIDKKERPDVLVSPGPTELGLVAEKGLIDTANQKSLGSFKLCVIAPKANKAKMVAIEDLARVKSISCPDPKLNSVGAAAQEALTNMGLWDKIQKQLVFAEIGHESHNHVAAGRVDAGISFLACPLDTNPEKLSKSKVTIVGVFPDGTYKEPSVEVAPLTEAKNPAAAKAFVEYLVSPEAQKILSEKELPGLSAETTGEGWPKLKAPEGTAADKASPAAKGEAKGAGE